MKKNRQKYYRRRPFVFEEEFVVVSKLLLNGSSFVFSDRLNEQQKIQAGKRKIKQLWLNRKIDCVERVKIEIPGIETYGYKNNANHSISNDYHNSEEEQLFKYMFNQSEETVTENFKKKKAKNRS